MPPRVRLRGADPQPGLGARRGVLAGMDRVLWQRLVLTGDEPHAVVAGVRRRRPVFVKVRLAAGLALRDAGVPTVTQAEAAP